jgi:hypothetical protein
VIEDFASFIQATANLFCVRVGCGRQWFGRLLDRHQIQTMHRYPGASQSFVRAGTGGFQIRQDLRHIPRQF